MTLPLRRHSSPHDQDACIITFAGPIDPEQGPPMVRVLGTLDALGSEFRLAVADSRMMTVTGYRTHYKDGSIDETFPMLVNPRRVETINHASKGDRRAAGWTEDAQSEGLDA